MPRDTGEQRPMQRLSHRQRLMPWHQVAERWNQQSGERVTRSRVWQIAKAAEEKLRKAIEQLEVDSG